MIPQRVVWGAFAVVLMVSWYLILAEFFQQAMGLVVIGLILTISISLALMPSPQTKRQYKVMFLAASAVSAGFSAGLYSGLFESAVLLDDSYIDISRSLALLHLKNNGLTGFAINEIKLGNISFIVGQSLLCLSRLQRGDEAYFSIYYPEKSLFRTHEAPTYFSPIHAGPSLAVDQELWPSAFRSGVSYPVVLTTNGILRHSFNIEARRTLDEELSIQASAHQQEHNVEVRLQFNNTGSYYVHVHSIEIANVAFHFEPPALVAPNDWPNGSFQILYLGFREEPGISWGSSMFIGNISATPEPQLSMLKIGETYEIRVRTMTNNIYVTNVTI
jgi:hypothetical protein